jgi:hypothetical protein
MSHISRGDSNSTVFSEIRKLLHHEGPLVLDVVAPDREIKISVHHDRYRVHCATADQPVDSITAYERVIAGAAIAPHWFSGAGSVHHVIAIVSTDPETTHVERRVLLWDTIECHAGIGIDHHGVGDISSVYVNVAFGRMVHARENCCAFCAIHSRIGDSKERIVFVKSSASLTSNDFLF